MKRRSGLWPVIVVLGALMTLGVLAIRAPRMPLAQGVDAPDEVFSAGRAMETVEVLAAEPHPLGTLAHEEIRDFLISRLADLGLEPETQDAVSISPRDKGMIVGARVRNIVARRPGQGKGDAILLLAHYDTRPGTPGAGDDSSGVAVVLECLRALGDESLANDLIVLFSDAEELGLLGARAFASEHRWSKDVRLVLNLEARGNGGPATMFETSPGNGRLIRLLAEAGPWPVADSFSYEVYRRMPNDTDYTVFRKLGIPGLNFAFTDGIEHYHTALDIPARLDRRSVQHLGSNVLGLLRAIGNEPLDLLEAPDAVYFNPWGGRRLIVYPAIWSRAAGLTGMAALLLLLILAERRGRLEGLEIVHGAAATLLAMIFAPAVVWGAWWLLESGWPMLTAGPHGLPYSSRELGLGMFLLVASVVAGFARWTWDRSGTPGSLGGVLVVWGMLALGTGFVIPGGSHLFQIPLLIALLPAAWLILGRPGPWLGLFLSSLVAAPAIVLLSPFVDFLHIAMTFDMVVPAAVFVALLCSPMTPLLGRLPAVLGTGLTAVVGIALLVFLATTAPQDADHPLCDDLTYLLDTDEGKAYWLSRDSASDAWTRWVLGYDPDRSSLPDYLGGPQPVLQSRAAIFAMASPRIEEVSNTSEGPGRTQVLRAFSDRRAPVLWIAFSGQSRMRVRRIGNQELERNWSDASETPIYFLAPPDQGIEFEIELLADEPLQVHVTDQNWPLPEDEGPGARPPGYIASSSWSTDGTFVHRSFTF